MRPDQANRACLLDMLHHAQGVVASLRSSSYEQYCADENLRLAIERRVEIIGEAARNVSAQFQEAHTQIPWRKIIAQRHVLAHDYGDIDPQLLWNVATRSIPELIDQLQKMLDAK